MPDLLTHEEYQAIAANMSFPVNAFINGKFQKPRSGRRMKTVNPATGTRVTKTVRRCD